MQAILAPNAPAGADFILLSEIAMGVALLAGGVLARRKRFQAHACCQAAVVLLNLVLIAAFMAPSFWRAVLPGLPRHLGRSYYWLATAHGMLGIGAESLALYVLLVAGTTIVPPRFRFTRYKAWMRSTLILWWLVLLLGLATYGRWYSIRSSMFILVVFIGFGLWSWRRSSWGTARGR